MDMLSMAITNETLGILIDIVVVVVLISYAIAGIAKGFIDSLLKFISSIGALVAAIFGAKPLLGLINGVWNISNVFANVVLNTLVSQNEIFGTTITALNKEDIITTLQGTEIFSVLKNFMIDLVQNAEVGQTVGQVVSAPIGYIISVIIVAVVIYLLIKLIMFFLNKLFKDKEMKDGGKSGIDRTLGLFLGTAKGLVFITASYLLLSLATYIPIISNTVTPIINETHIVKPTYSIVDEQVNKFIVEQDWNEIISGIFDINNKK